MVSTRGIHKVRFQNGERVLCYEPDPTKVRVVYDAKILQIATSLDLKGKRINEFLVHFQGWNSSWDRYVPEDFLLKDNEENRELQRVLFEKADDIRQNLRGKKRKRDSGKQVSYGEISSCEDDSGSATEVLQETAPLPQTPVPETTKPEKFAHGLRRKAKDNDVEEENFVPVRLPESLKQRLEEDFVFVNKRRRLTRLPADPNIVTVLEMFVRNYAVVRLVSQEKQLYKYHASSSYRKPSDPLKEEDFERALTNINICKEIAEGLRVIIDFNLSTVLLYDPEKSQFETTAKECRVNGIAPPKPTVNGSDKHKPSDHPNVEVEDPDSSKRRTNRLSLSSLRDRRVSIETSKSAEPPGPRVGSSKDSSTSGRSTPTHMNATNRHPTSTFANSVLADLQNWRLLPRVESEVAPVIPSLVYGPIHLLRLFVKMPEILGKMKIPPKTTKMLVKYMDSLMEYLNVNAAELFGESMYENP